MCIIKGQIKLRTFFVCALYRSGKEYFCSGGQNVRPIQKSFAQQEKNLEGTLCTAEQQVSILE